MAAMARGVALVANTAAVAALTGTQDLVNLETGGEITIASLLIAASDAIFDQLAADGVDGTLLSNAEVFERAVAWHLVAMLTIGGYLAQPEGLEPPKNELGQADPYAWSDPYYNRVRPELTSGDEAARAGQVVPRVGNLRRNPILNPTRTTGGVYYTERPTKRT